MYAQRRRSPGSGDGPILLIRSSVSFASTVEPTAGTSPSRCCSVHPFDDQTIPKNISYYYPRSAHDSSLSRVADSWVLARADRPGSWDVFTEALVTDVADIQGGTTPEGIHLGAQRGDPARPHCSNDCGFLSCSNVRR